jgi:hypothetical protein
MAEGDEYDLRLLCKIALLIGGSKGVGIDYGDKFDSSARFLVVYQLEDCGWKLILDASVSLHV